MVLKSCCIENEILIGNVQPQGPGTAGKIQLSAACGDFVRGLMDVRPIPK